MSEDGGTSWTNITFSTCLGDQLQSLAWFEDTQLFLAQGSSTCHHNMIHSTNGLLWNPHTKHIPLTDTKLPRDNGWVRHICFDNSKMVENYIHQRMDKIFRTFRILSYKSTHSIYGIFYLVGGVVMIHPTTIWLILQCACSPKSPSEEVVWQDNKIPKLMKIRAQRKVML